MNLKNAKRSEDTEQIAVVYWAIYNAAQYPELKWLHHVPNGGRRNKQEPVKLMPYQKMKEANNSIWKEGTVTHPKWR